jgi:hypothetical protein
MLGTGISFGLTASFGSHLQIQLNVPHTHEGISPRSKQETLQEQNVPEQVQERWASSSGLLNRIPAVPKATIKIEIIVFIKKFLTGYVLLLFQAVFGCPLHYARALPPGARRSDLKEPC